MHELRIDRSKRLVEDPSKGHNRYHPDIEPVLEVEVGDEVVFETRDSVDGQLPPGSGAEAIGTLDADCIHPLTGPVYIRDARPGDVLEVEFLDIEAGQHGYSAIVPGLGFLNDVFDKPWLVHWKLDAGFATSEQIPGVRIPAASFMGISAVAPSHEKLTEWAAREQALIDAGGMALPPTVSGAIPGGCGLSGLRTLPPRENGGNFDVKQLTSGASVYLPVFVEGALFSCGDAHFAQGDGEVCVTAIEMSATAAVRFKLHKGLAQSRRVNAPVFSHHSYRSPTQQSGRILGAMGMPIDDQGRNDGGNLNLACRNALLNMIELLGERGFTPEQAYIICSVAVDLHISNVVDVPNFVVSALLPEMIFD